MPNSIDSEAIYLYCFASSALLSTVEGMGVDGKNPVFLLPYRDVVAVAGLVSEEEFDAHSAKGGSRDVAWVGPRACRHEEVVERAIRYSPVMPVPLGTIFDSHESLENRLKNQHDVIKRFLDKVSGQDEWGVRGIVNRVGACEQYLRETLSVRSGRLAAAPGARPPDRRGKRSAVRKTMRRMLENLCKDLGEDLSRIAADRRVRQKAGCESAARDKDIILSLAFLVQRDSASEFCARIRTANDECDIPGLVFELSGPWPPYSFCPPLEEQQACR